MFEKFLNGFLFLFALGLVGVVLFGAIQTGTNNRSKEDRWYASYRMEKNIPVCDKETGEELFLFTGMGFGPYRVYLISPEGEHIRVSGEYFEWRLKAC